MFGAINVVSMSFIILTAISSQAGIIIKNKQNVPLFEKNPGEKIYELTGKASGTTLKHSVAVIDFAPKASSVPHIHPIVEESYYVLGGEAKIIIGKDEAIIKEGDLVVNSTKHTSSSH